MTRFAFAAALFLTLTVSVSAAFTGTDLIVPATGRAPGAGGSQFYTTFWITNPGDSTADVIIQFLLAGQSNTAPASFNDTIAPGATKVYENVAESLFNIRNGLGAARVVGSQKLLLSIDSQFQLTERCKESALTPPRRELAGAKQRTLSFGGDTKRVHAPFQ